MSHRPLRAYVVPGLVLSLSSLFAACGDDGTGNAGGEGGSGDVTSSGSSKSSSRASSASSGSGSTATSSGSTSTATSASSAVSTTAGPTTGVTTATVTTGATTAATTAASSSSSGLMPGEVCGDGIDNDMNGAIDCADAACASAISCNTVVINELDYDRNGTDEPTVEFIELFNDGPNAVVLDGVELILVNGNTMGGPAPYTTVDLSGNTIPAGGFLVAGGSAVVVPGGVPLVTFGGGIQNGQTGGNLNGDAVALWDTVSETLLDAVSYENTVAGADIHGTLIDVFEGTPTSADLDLGNTDPNLAYSLNRFPDGTDTDDNGADFFGSASVTPGAANVLTEHCSSLFDEDGDGLVDCNDPDCSASPSCGEICTDGVDNNANGQIDCAEASCDMLSCGGNGQVCAANACTCPNGNVEVCGDLADNNCDGLIDCADPTCSGAPACSEICNDGVDNNGNGQVDCAEALCDGQSCGANGVTCAAGACSCPGGNVEVCGDAVDNNCNGQVDCAEASCAATPACMVSCMPSVVLSQVYGGGGNAGATFTHDFIELHNRGAVAVDIGGWSVQYASATGATGFTQKLDVPAPTILPAGGYYLIQMASQANVGAALPTPDLSGTIAMAGGSGKVALVSDGVLLGATCTGPTVVDLLGYGPTATCSETMPTAVLSATLSGQRNGNGCADTGNNSADFTVALPAPRNSATAVATCTCN